MDIILISRSGVSRTLRCAAGCRAWFVLGTPIALATFVLLGAGFWVGGVAARHTASHSVAADPDSAQAVLDALRAQVAGQQQEIEQARRAAGANVDALSRKIAQLQADVMRLDAVGRRMVEVAHIDAAEFDFAHPAPLGGPDQPLDDRVGLSAPGLDQLDAMQATLANRQREFAVLEDILRTAKLRKETQPRGWPIDNGYLSSGFGYRVDPFTGRSSFHPGVDLAGPKGTPVRAVAAGIVTQAGVSGGYGKMVEINHGNGVVTVYGHNSKLLVKVGQKVLRGQPVALEGSTGHSTGPHCHFEVRINDRPVNPMKFLQAAR